MTIKKLVVGSMFSMLLGSGMAAADWGDVYFCQMTNLLEITLYGEQKNYKLEKFQFKLDKTKNAMVFGSTGYLGNIVIEFIKGKHLPSEEFWHTKSEYSDTYFEEGKLLYTQSDVSSITAVTADCEKF